MSLDLSKMKVIPFVITEEEAVDRLIDILSTKKNIPLDFACSIKNISFTKSFFPVRKFNIKFSADWSALSLWKEKQPFTETKSVAAYYDFNGKEHNTPGFDHFRDGKYMYSSSGGGGTKGDSPWRVQQKLITKTHYRTVVVDAEYTNGHIGILSTTQTIVDGEVNNQKFLNWLRNYRYEGYSTDFNENDIVSYEIKKLYGSDSSAKETALKNAYAIAKQACKKQIPGDDYKDLNISNFRANCDMDIFLLPVMQITYLVNDKKYDFWINASDASQVFFLEYPIDNDLKEKERSFNQRLRSKKRSRNICLILFIALIICSPEVVAFKKSFIIALLIVIGIEVVLFKLYKKFKKDAIEMESIEMQEQEKANQIKKTIIEISKDPNLDAKTKKEKIQHIKTENQD